MSRLVRNGSRLLTSRFNKALSPLSDIEPRKTTYDATTVQDLSANNKDLTLLNGAYVENDYIRLVDSNDVARIDNGAPFSGDITLDLWVELDSAAGSYATLMGNTTTMGTLPNGVGFRRSAASNDIQIWAYGTNAKYRVYKNGSLNRADTAINGNSGIAYGVLELGKLINITVVFQGVNATLNNYMYLCSYIAESTGSVKSKIYAAKIYNRALTDREVYNNYINFVGGLPLVSQSKQPYVLSFDGLISRAVYNNNIPLKPTTEGFTIEAAVYLPTELPNQAYYPRLLSIKNSLGLTQNRIEVAVCPAGRTGGELLRHFRLEFVTGNNSYQSVVTDVIIPLQQWSIIGMSFIGSTKELRMYMNGKYIKSYTMTSVTTAAMADSAVYDQVVLGDFVPTGSGTNALKHNLGYARIWKGVRTDAEMEANYTKILGYHPNLLEEFVPTYTGIKANKSSVIGTNTINIPSTAPVGQRSGLKTLNAGEALRTSIPVVTDTVAQHRTYEVWVRPLNTSRGFLFGWSEYGASATQRLYVAQESGYWAVGYMDKSSFDTGKSTTTLSYGRWYHACLVVGAGVIDLYINSIKVFTVAHTTFATAGQFSLGGIMSNASSAQFGLARVWDKKLTITEMDAVRHSYLPADYPNLIEQWKLNEGLGSVAYGTKGNNGSITGATWTTPSLMNYVGKHLRVDTSNMSVRIPDKPLFNSQQFTVECIVKFKTVGSPEQPFFTKWYITPAKYGFFLEALGDKIRGVVRTPSSGNIAIIGTTTIVSNINYHVALVQEATLLKLYINGVLEATSSSALGVIFSPETDIVLGDFGNYVSASYKGNVDLDECRYWNIARTQAEIQENMNRTLDRHPNLLLNMGFESGYWDASGYGNHGTAVGSPVIEVTDNDKLLLNAPIN